MTTNAYVDIEKLVRDVVNGIGYDRGKKGFDGSTCAVMVAMSAQSPDIARGVDQNSRPYRWNTPKSTSTPAARRPGHDVRIPCDETRTADALPIYLSHKLCRRMAKCAKTARSNGCIRTARPGDAEYHYGKPAASIPCSSSTQHADKLAGKTVTNEDKSGRFNRTRD